MLAIGSDHGGFRLKSEIIEYLACNNIGYKDFGTFDGCAASNYPDFGLLIAEAVRSGDYETGIAICGTGIGISISANKVPGIRAALCTDSYMSRMAREHNNANVLALGGRVTGIGEAIDIIETWLSSSFQGGRHKTRVDLISSIEDKYIHQP